MRIRFKRKRPAERPEWMSKVLARERAMRWRIAEALRKRAAQLSARQLRWMAVLFVAGGMATYMWIGIRALDQRKPAGKVMMHVDTIWRPRGLHQRQ